jgi:uncharacterized membrane protein YfcA
MTPALAAALGVIMLTTAFLSGLFGMAGGLILMGVLLAALPLPDAMALHAVTQMASNGSRGLLWVRHVRWRVAGVFLFGCALAFGAWAAVRFVPPTPLAFLLLGLSPFAVRILPIRLQPKPELAVHGMAYGIACMSLMMVAGVAGPLIDSFFLGGNLDRREIIATKAVCQMCSHGAKLAYFGTLVAGAAQLEWTAIGLAGVASLAGTSLAKPVLQRLTDTQYRVLATHVITAISLVYLGNAAYLLAK